MEPLENFTLRLKPDDIDYSKEIVINDLIIQIIDNDSEIWLFFVLYIHYLLITILLLFLLSSSFSILSSFTFFNPFPTRHSPPIINQ